MSESSQPAQQQALEALRMAREALHELPHWATFGSHENPTLEDLEAARDAAQQARDAIAAIDDVLASPALKPAARVNNDGFIVETGFDLAPGTLLYTTAINAILAQPEQPGSTLGDSVACQYPECTSADAACRAGGNSEKCIQTLGINAALRKCLERQAPQAPMVGMGEAGLLVDSFQRAVVRNERKETHSHGTVDECLAQHKQQREEQARDVAITRAALLDALYAAPLAPQPSQRLREAVIALRDSMLHEATKTDTCYTCYTEQAAYVAGRLNAALAAEAAVPEVGNTPHVDPRPVSGEPSTKGRP